MGNSVDDSIIPVKDCSDIRVRVSHLEDWVLESREPAKRKLQKNTLNKQCSPVPEECLQWIIGYTSIIKLTDKNQNANPAQSNVPETIFGV